MNPIAAALFAVAAFLPQDAPKPPERSVEEMRAQMEAMRRQMEELQATIERLRAGRPGGGEAPGTAEEWRTIILRQTESKAEQERRAAELQELEQLLKAVEARIASADGPKEQLLKEREQLVARLEEFRSRARVLSGRRFGPSGDFLIEGVGPRIDPKIQKLEQESREIGDQIRRLPAEEKEKRAELRARLDKTLGDLFDQREAGRWKELEDLDARVKDLRQSLETRKQNKGKIIERRARELSGERDDMDW